MKYSRHKCIACTPQCSIGHDAQRIEQLEDRGADHDSATDFNNGRVICEESNH